MVEPLDLRRARESFADSIAALELGKLAVAAVHSQRAWDACDAAEANGIDRETLLDLRLAMWKHVLLEYIPIALGRAANIRDDEERAGWYRGLRSALLAALGWYDREVAAGHLVGGEMLAANIAETIGALEGMQRAPLA
jgi:hypothetical protein